MSSQQDRRRSKPAAWESFESLHLGDLVTVPGTGPLAVRLVASYEASGRSGKQFFAVLGDGERLLLPDAGAVVVSVPIDKLPARVQSAKVTAEGRSGYLAAHTPICEEGLDVVAWRVLRVAGLLHPLILLYRGPQLLVYMPSGSVESDQLSVVKLPRDGRRQQVRRSTGVLDLPAATVERPQSARNTKSGKTRRADANIS